MALRTAKLLLILALAVYYTIVVFNNLTDYDSNYQFVRHVLMMDSTLAGNRGMWRALNSRAWHTTFYISIIAWEAVTMLLLWWGGWRMQRSLRASAEVFHQSKRIAIAGLTLGMLMWLGAFLTIGGEWFLMWQSRTWNGQDAAFRMFTMVGIVLLLVAQRDADQEP